MAENERDQEAADRDGGRDDEQADECRGAASRQQSRSGGAEGENGKESVAAAVADEERETGTSAQRRKVDRLTPFFDGLALIVYSAIGVLLLGLAVASLGYAVSTIPKNFGEDIPRAIATLLSELLLVLILMEILRTVLSYLDNKTLSIRPFLTVAAISSVRRILSIGAELSLVEEVPREEFNRAMIELAADGFVILIVGISLYLISRREGGN